MMQLNSWRRLRPLDTGRSVRVSLGPNDSVLGVLEHVYGASDEDHRGLVTVRYPDGVTGTLSQSQVTLLPPAVGRLPRY